MEEKRNHPQIKICGLKRKEDIQAVNRLEPEYIGFVFAKKGHRTVSDETAAELKKLLNPGIKAVGVFIKEPIEHVAELFEKGIIDIAQLHGEEDESYVKELRRQTKVPIIRAFRVETKEDIQRAENFDADYILLDNGGGGTGRVFDWSLLKGIKRPYFLAGGLSPENVREAMKCHPWGLDVSSGVETERVKDPEKMQAFVDTVRSF